VIFSRVLCSTQPTIILYILCIRCKLWCGLFDSAGDVFYITLHKHLIKACSIKRNNNIASHSLLET